MKCPQCSKDGLKSIVYVRYNISTALNWNAFYDEEGKYHVHNPNIHTQYYGCSRDHIWSEESQGKCPTCGEWWKQSGPHSERHGG